MGRNLTAAAVTAAAVLLAAGGMAPATAARSAEPFVPGTGAASSEVGRIALRSSGASLAFGVGGTRARYAGAQGNAETYGLDMGLLEVASKAPVACGTSMGSLFPAEAMPKRLHVSSGDGASSARAASAGEGTPVEIMSQSGSAKPGSAADAGVVGVRMEIPGLLSAVGGTAESAALLTPGQARTAQGGSGLGSLTLAGGLVRLEGMRWTASHRTGARPDSSAGFTIGGMTVAGQAMPVSDAPSLSDSLAAANAALAPLGLALNAPRVDRSVRGIGVTPMQLSIAPTPALRTLLATALEGVQPVRTQLLTILQPFKLAKDCGLATAVGFGYLIADLTLVVLGDNGRVDLEFGGATAGTRFLTYANPLASGFGALLPRGNAGAAGDGLPGASIALPAGGAPSGAVPGTAPVAGGASVVGPVSTGSTGAGARSAQVTVPLERGSPVAAVCRSTHPGVGAGCARHVGALAGWLVLALILVLAAADRLRALRSAPPRSEVS
jgi:hypothetical protein